MTRTSRILAAVSAGLIFCFAARGGQNVSLTWDPSVDPATRGYILHCGTVSHVYTAAVNVGTNTVVTLSGLTAGQTYYFVVGGYDSAGVEGKPSNQASFVVPTNGAIPPSSPASIVVTPASGAVGTRVSIYGANLSGATGVSFNGVFASFTVVSNAFLSAVVPAGATTGPLDITTPAGTIAGRFTVTATTGPANDAFANAQVLTGTNVFTWINTALATKEPGEPNHAGNSGGASVWYRWTAPASGTFSLDTQGSQFSPLVAVYKGNSISQLSVVASNAATAGEPLSFSAAGGVTYQIAVDGFWGTSGEMQLRLSPPASSTTVFYDTFDSGVIGYAPLAGQNGWVSTVPALSGVGVNYFPAYGQQGYIGFAATALNNNVVRLYHPLNFTVDTNNLPIIQFSTLLQVYNPINLFHDSFGWVFQNAAGQDLFSVAFNNGNGQVTYSLDDGAGQRPCGYAFSTISISQLIITADFSRNQWSATLNGALIVAGQPMTTGHAALTLGDIAAEGIYSGLQSGADGMLFDFYSVTANPDPAPRILLGPQNQTITPGGDLVLGAVASGGLPLSYQWYFNGTKISGATNAGLWLTNAVAAESGSYAVVVTNASGVVGATCTVNVSGAQAKAQLAGLAPMGNSGRMVSFGVTSGHSYQLQGSTNLTTWSNLCSFYTTGSNAAYFDGAAGSIPRRFYRLKSP